MDNKKGTNIISKVVISIMIAICTFICAAILYFIASSTSLNMIVAIFAMFITPFMLIPLLIPKYRKKLYIFSCFYTLLVIVAIIGNSFI